MKVELFEGEYKVVELFGPNPIELLDSLVHLFRYNKLEPKAIDLQTMEEFTIKFTRA